MKIDFTKLLGFDTAAEELSYGLDLQRESLGDKLGAKIGPPEETSPTTRIDLRDAALGAKLGAKVGELESG
jgi:hypothetical protein